ncbi:MAG: hypothetical protein IPL46_20820 [Saprospiraceae bacterium]|nr:hypothetical protein [Saprospiraceae bacterium]
MKHCIFLKKLMMIALVSSIFGVSSAANSSMVEKAIFEGRQNSSRLASELIETKEVSITLLSEVETFQLGIKIFGGEKGLTAIGSGFAQTAPGATEDLNPDLDTKQPPAIECLLSFASDNDLRNQLIKLIEKPNLSSLEAKNLEAWLHVIINQRKELVVLLVETDNDFVDQYLKSKLNYKKLSPTTAAGRYTVKVTLKNG